MLLLFVFLLGFSDARASNEPVKMVYSQGLDGTYYQDLKEYIEISYQTIGEQIKFIDRPVGRSIISFINKEVDADLARKMGPFDATDGIRVPTPLDTLRLLKFCIFYRCDEIEMMPENKQVGVSIRGAAFLKNVPSSYTVQLVNSKFQMVKMLIFGRADYILMPIAPRGIFSKTLKPLGEPIVEFQLYHWVQQSHKDLVPKLDKYFKANPFSKKELPNHNKAMEDVKSSIQN